MSIDGSSAASAKTSFKVEAQIQYFPSVAVRSPTGFLKATVAATPLELRRFVGYDPRTLERAGKGKSLHAGNVSAEIVALRQTYQRIVAEKRSAEMTEYLRRGATGEGYADFPPIELATKATPEMARFESERLVGIPMSAEFFIPDGHHRYCACLDFANLYPELASKFTQLLVISFFPATHFEEWCAQSFHDRNHLMQPVARTKALVADSRDPHNRLANDLSDHPVVRKAGGINNERDALTAKAKEFTTRGILHKLSFGFAEGRLESAQSSEPMKLTAANYDSVRDRAFEYLDDLADVFPTWTTEKGRDDYLHRSSTVLQALGVIGYRLFTSGFDGEERRAKLACISEKSLDWRRTNVATWDKILGIANNGVVTPRSDRQHVEATLGFLSCAAWVEQRTRSQVPCGRVCSDT